MPGSSHCSEQRLEVLRQLPLEPAAYCDRWVERDPNRSYRKACINSLAKATGLSCQTVKDWESDFSRRPRYIPHLLRQVGLLNQLQSLSQNQRVFIPFDALQE